MKHFENNFYWKVEIIQQMQVGFEKGQNDLKVEMKEVNENLSLQNKMINDLNDIVNVLYSQFEDIKKKNET